MNGEGDMDALARKLLYNDAVAPPDALWARLESQITTRGKGLLPFFFAKYAWLGLVMAATGAAAWWLLQGDALLTGAEKQYTERIQRTQDNTIAKTSKGSIDISAQPYTSAQQHTGDAQSAVISEIESGNKYPANSQSKIPVAQSQPNAHNHHAGSNTAAMILPPDIGGNFLDEPSGEDGIKSPAVLRAGIVSPGDAKLLDSTEPYFAFMEPREAAPFAFSPMLIDRANEVDFGPKPLRGWYAGAFADLRSTSLRISGVQEGTSGLVDSLTSAEYASANMGAGIYFGYHLKPKWRLSGGLAFAKWCRTTQYPILFTVADAYEGTLASDGQTIPLEQHIISATGMQIINVNAPSLELTNVAQTIPQNASLAKQLEVAECYNLLQVPLMIEYQHSTGRFGFLPGAGLAYEHVLRRSTRLTGSGSEALDGSVVNAEASRKNFLSFVASLHMEFMLTEHISLRTGANYRAWLTPVYQSDQIKTYPRLVSIDAGIIYIFNRR